MHSANQVSSAARVALFLSGQLAIVAATQAWAGPPSVDARRSDARSQEVTLAADSFTPAARHRPLESVLGKEVRTRVEEDVGRIVDLLADRQGRVQAAVIEFGGFLGIGTRKIAVEWSALSFESDGKQPAVIVEMTRDQLRIAPEYKANEPAIVRRVVD